MAWWLAYEELYGDMDKEYPIMSKEKDDIIILGGDDTISADRSQTGNFLAAESVNLDWHTGGDYINFDLGAGNTAFTGSSEDSISFGGLVDDVYAYHYPGTEKETAEWERIEKPKPNLKNGSTQKYEEDKGIADLKSYVASTYQGHYTNENSDVQTLDLIHSVGDAESFCRSNALKYLSRYDKKGSAKNDILKAMHYCLLLYYFSGNTQEPDYTNTRYETF